MLDLPGIIEGASQGKGRGKQVIAVARTADLILMMLDATKSDVQRTLLERELEAVGIRLNKSPPNIYFKPKTSGGLSFTATCKLTHMSEKMAYNILHEYKIHNVEVVVREDVTVDEFIDVVDGDRKYIQCLYCYNKIDHITMEEVKRLADIPHTVVVSCELNLGLDWLVEQLWQHLGLLRLYTKKRGAMPDFSDALIVRSNATVEHVCHVLHRQLADIFKYAHIWVKTRSFMLFN